MMKMVAADNARIPLENFNAAGDDQRRMKKENN